MCWPGGVGAWGDAERTTGYTAGHHAGALGCADAGLHPYAVV
jgi:hypothetical protein